MKLRESRWAANNNRMKERIETLEREKIELKESLRIAEKHRMETLNKLATSASINSNLRSATPTQQQTSRSMKSPQSSIEHDYVSYSDRDVFNVAPWTTSDYNQVISLEPDIHTRLKIEYEFEFLYFDSHNWI